MNLEQAIRGHWAGHEPLVTRVPLARFWTGAAPPGAELPFVVLDVVRVETRLTTSTRRLIEHATVRFAVHAGERATGAEIIAEIERRFERADLTLDEGRLLDMRREKAEQRVGADGVWSFAAEYLAITEHVPLGD